MDIITVENRYLLSRTILFWVDVTNHSRMPPVRDTKHSWTRIKETKVNNDHHIVKSSDQFCNNHHMQTLRSKWHRFTVNSSWNTSFCRLFHLLVLPSPTSCFLSLTLLLVSPPYLIPECHKVQVPHGSFIYTPFPSLLIKYHGFKYN